MPRQDLLLQFTGKEIWMFLTIKLKKKIWTKERKNYLVGHIYVAVRWDISLLCFNDEDIKGKHNNLKTTITSYWVCAVCVLMTQW